jgi:hypothetical protein
MERAHVMLDHNFREEALRLAAVAEQLEKSKQAVYHPGEERPSELVAQLQQSGGSSSSTDGASAADRSRAESNQKRVYRNRSIQEDPRRVASRTGRIVLTDISAGWQPAGESKNADSTTIEPAAAGKSDPASGQNQVAHLETPAKADGQGASRVEAAPAPAPLAVADASGAPAALAKDGKEASESEVTAAGTEASSEEFADSDSSIESDAPATTVSRWNATTITGLIAGLGGLLGLAFWRRQERKHYAAATR